MKIKNRTKLYLLGVFVGIVGFLASCIEPFEPTLNDAANKLVVDGLFTNLPGPYTVRLSFSTSPYILTNAPLGGAKVIISEENGPEEILVETEEGVYKTAEGGIQGIAGKNYKIIVQTPDDQQYESPFQELKKPHPIESITYAIENLYFDNAGKEIAGYQFYLNTPPSENEENYYLWLQEGAFRYTSTYPLTDIYDNGSLTRVVDPFAFSTCYDTHFIDEVRTYNTSSLVGNKVENLPLTFVRADTRFLSDRYSLLVKQLSLSKDAYNHWRDVERQIANLDNLYASQPFQIGSNLTNTKDEKEEVLGYFTVAGVSEKRVFVDAPFGKVVDIRCELDPSSFPRVRRDRTLWPANIYSSTEVGTFFFNNGCLDCRIGGGVIAVPDFWED